MDEDKEFDMGENEEARNFQFRHKKMLEAVTSIAGRKRKIIPQRSEPRNEVSEYTVSETGHGKIKLHELAASLGNTKTHALLKKQILQTEKKQQVLPVPLDKTQTDKIKRSLNYEKTKTDVSKWDSVIYQNRLATHTTYPLNQANLKLKTATELTKGFKPITPLEKEVLSLLQSSNNFLKDDKILTAAEEEAVKAMSLEEALERRSEMQKMRALQSHMEHKARRQNKIKSKRYHRLLKRENLKQCMKDFEELKQKDPEAALLKLDEINNHRILERMTLRHRTTGKWAKHMAIRAKYDRQSRVALSEQLQVNRELTQKKKTQEENSEEEKDDPQPLKSNVLRPVDPFNPWLNAKLAKTDNSESISEESPSYHKVWEKSRKDIEELKESKKENISRKRKEKISHDTSLELQAKRTLNNAIKKKLREKPSNAEKSSGTDDSESEPEDSPCRKTARSKRKTDVRKRKESVKQKILRKLKEKKLQQEQPPEDAKKKKLRKKIKAKQKLERVGKAKSTSEEPPSDDRVQKESETDVEKPNKKKKIVRKPNEKISDDAGHIELQGEQTPKVSTKRKLKKKKKPASVSESESKSEEPPSCAQEQKGNENVVKKVIGKKKNSKKLQQKKSNEVAGHLKLKGEQMTNGVLKKKLKKKTMPRQKLASVSDSESKSEDPPSPNIVQTEETSRPEVKKLSKKERILKKLQEKRQSQAEERSGLQGEPMPKRAKQSELPITVNHADGYSGLQGKPNPKRTKQNELPRRAQMAELRLKKKINLEKTKMQIKKKTRVIPKTVAEVSLLKSAPEEVEPFLSESTSNDLNDRNNRFESSISETQVDPPSQDELPWTSANEKPKEVQIDPKKFITLKTKTMKSSIPSNIESDDDSGSEDREDPRMTIAEAFADDDVVRSFREEKLAVIEQNKPKDVDLFLPGWGTWAGTGIKTNRQKKKRFLIKAPPVQQRKDTNMGNVIINEKENKTLSKLQVSELPFPFTNVHEYEKTLKAPLGKLWNSETAFKKLTEPKVVTKPGAVIDPMDEDALTNKKPKKRLKSDSTLDCL